MERKMHRICMEIVAHSLNAGDKNKIGVLTFGGYTFRVDGKSIPFDWTAYGTSPTQNEDGTITLNFESGRGIAFDDFEIDECLHEDIREAGVEPETIDAAYLASTDYISEIFYEFNFTAPEEENEPIWIESITFSDCDDWNNVKDYPVDKAVIEAYNKMMLGDKYETYAKNRMSLGSL